MTKAIITGGLVSVEDGNKAAEEYAPARKVRVEISFSTELGGDLEAASALASAQVDQLLGRSKAKAPTTAAPKERTAEEIAAADAAKLAHAGKEGAGAGTPPKAKAKAKDKPADAPAPKEEDELTTSSETTQEPASELAGEPQEEWETEAAPITDKELNDACSKKNAALQGKGGPKIRELARVVMGAPEGKVVSVRELPPEKRADFLKKLEALE